MKCKINNQNLSASLTEYFDNLANSLPLEEMLSKYIENIPAEHFWEIIECICLEVIQTKVDINEIKNDILSHLHTNMPEDRIFLALFSTLMINTSKYAEKHMQKTNALLDELSELVRTHFATLMSIHHTANDKFGISFS